MPGVGSSFGLVLACPIALACWVAPVEAAKINNIYSFQGGTADGAYPLASLAVDVSGNLYGTTSAGGGTGCKNGCGTVFKLTLSSNVYSYSQLYSFQGPPNDGAVPVAGLVVDQAGNLYGTTSQGGGTGCNGYGCGTIFELTSDGKKYTEAFLYPFKGGIDGQDPRAGLIVDSSGSNLYGTTAEGGVAQCGYFQAGCGTVFKIAINGTNKTTLYAFQGSGASPPDGESPRAAVVMDGDGNLYGTTLSGGATTNSSVCVYESCGVVFELTPNATSDKILYSFSGGKSDGANPVGSLVLDLNGNLDGATLYGGSTGCFMYGCGTAFQIQLPVGGVDKLLHKFKPKDGEAPVAGLIADTSGNLYSVACGSICNGGGAPTRQCPRGCQYGTVYSVQATQRTKGSFMVLSPFDNKNGSSPVAPLLLDENTMTLYGTTQNGGALNSCVHGQGCGTVFSIAIGGK